MKKGLRTIILALAISAAFLAGAWVSHKSASKEAGSGGRKVLYYVDPMHPAYRSDKPGIAPDCGMQLEPVYADGAPGASAASGAPGTVTVSREKRDAVGVELGNAEKAPWTGTVRLLGRVTPDEARTYKVTAASDIWVRRVFPPTTGSFVRKDEPLAAYFTSGYLSAANAYLFALNTRQRHQQGGDTSQAQAQNLDYQMRTAFGNLINIGVSESQIREMEKTGTAGEMVEIRSPSDGFLLERSVSPGQFIEAGDEMYRIADLRKVWILAETYENEGGLLGPGMTVKVVQPQSKRVVSARVTGILPQFDSQTRTTKVRLEADNPGYLLRPGMFVDIEIPVRMPPALSVPAEAILDAGTRKTVYVESGDGRFEPRAVETGSRMGDRVEVTKGLSEGERVVVSGTFLVDSESRMKLAAAGIYGAWHVDPVCGMHLDEGKAKAAGRMVDHGGETHYFCSEDCVTKFRMDPSRYGKTPSPAIRKMEMPIKAAAAHGSHGHDDPSGMK